MLKVVPARSPRTPCGQARSELEVHLATISSLRAQNAALKPQAQAAEQSRAEAATLRQHLEDAQAGWQEALTSSSQAMQAATREHRQQGAILAAEMREMEYSLATLRDRMVAAPTGGERKRWGGGARSSVQPSSGSAAASRAGICSAAGGLASRAAHKGGSIAAGLSKVGGRTQTLAPIPNPNANRNPKP